MEYYCTLPLKKDLRKKIRVGDILYVTGILCTARDQAHKKLLNRRKASFITADMALYHCGPLMKKEHDRWVVLSAGPTTSSRMEEYEAAILKRYGFSCIIGKGGMGEKTQEALQANSSIYASYTGGAGVLAAKAIQEVKNVYWLEELGMVEAVWIFDVCEFGPLIVALDAHGRSLYRHESNR
ncbi:MAG: FumA C-terminus/TtdB family hydratase beta subunit [Candidatus Thermoplasmatota archaeon]